MGPRYRAQRWGRDLWEARGRTPLYPIPFVDPSRGRSMGTPLPPHTNFRLEGVSFLPMVPSGASREAGGCPVGGAWCVFRGLGGNWRWAKIHFALGHLLLSHCWVLARLPGLGLKAGSETKPPSLPQVSFLPPGPGVSFRIPQISSCGAPPPPQPQPLSEV